MVRTAPKSPTYSIAILPPMIKDPKVPVPLTVDISFRGEYENFPKGVVFELYENGKLRAMNPPEVTVTTVVDGKVNYFKPSGNVNIDDVEGIIRKVKAEKNLPADHRYFVVSGKIKAPLEALNCPKEIKLKMRVRYEGGSSEKEFEFSLGEKEYGKASNRPFG